MRRLAPQLFEDRRRSAGFALIIVLWTLVLIAFIVAQLTASGRTEIRIAGNLVANSVAEAAADGAVYQAIFNLSDPRPDRRWPVDGSMRELAIGSSRVMLRLEDEAWWINPSSASPALLEALLRVTGSDPQSARSLGAAIAEWVGSTPLTRPQNTLLAEYRAAGLDYGPPGGPLESLDELGRVLGMTPDMFAAIRPHLTLFGPPEPDPASPDPVVSAALALLKAGRAGAGISQPLQALQQDLKIVRITALASGPGNARVTRAATVRTGAAFLRGYEIVAWGHDPNSGPPLVIADRSPPNPNR